MNIKVTIMALCSKLQMTRQNYYKTLKEAQIKESDMDVVEELVRAERRVQHGFSLALGGRKVLFLIKPKLAEQGIKIGRDRLFDMLRARDMLVKRPHSFTPTTTNSRHCLPVFCNLVKDMKLTHYKLTSCQFVVYGELALIIGASSPTSLRLHRHTCRTYSNIRVA